MNVTVIPKPHEPMLVRPASPRRQYRRGRYDDLWATLDKLPKGQSIVYRDYTAAERRQLRALAYARRRKFGIPYVTRTERAQPGVIEVYIEE